MSGYDQALASNLPYGLQRRVEIARALAGEPRLILLDEPVAGMNDSETEEIARLIKKILGFGITILLIEHDMSMVMKVCDRLVVLNFGEKIAEGAPPGDPEQSPGHRSLPGSGRRVGDPSGSLNPKFEARNPKQARRSKIQMIKTKNSNIFG